MANTPPKRPSSPSKEPQTVAPPPAKPASKPATGRMMTPPPPSARKSSGQMPAFGAAGGQTPPPPPARAPGGAGATGQPARRPVIAAKPQGLPIKMKVVLSMSALSIGIVIIMFLIVQLVGRAALEDTIKDSGRANLQQAEANYRNYVQTLTDTGMIAYFQSRKDKFGKYWDGLHGAWPASRGTSAMIRYPWFNKDVPGCRQFANYNQLVNDRIWVMVASEIRGNYGEVANIPEDKKAAIIGKDAYDFFKKFPTSKMAEPSAPRQINDEAMKDISMDFFNDLATAYKCKGKPWSDLRAAIAKETMDTLVSNSTGGIRRAIFTEYKKEFVDDLDKLTTADDTQVRLVVFEIKGAILPGFDPEKDLSVVSPSKDGKPDVSESSAKRTEKDMEIDPAASVGSDPAFSFSRVQGGGAGDKVHLYLDRKFINARQSNLVLLLFGVAFVAVLISLGTAFLVGGNITRPLQVLMSDIQIISGGNFDHKPIAQSRDEVGIVSRLLGDMAAGLKQAQEVWAENQSRKHDLDIAKEIQENLLPKHVPRIAGYDVSAYYSPSKEVGGDYYDFFLVDKTHLGMICADVSGKGIPGSMVMMMTKALVSYEAESNLSPRDIFCKVNRTLAKDIKRGMFVTAFYMLLDIPTARLTVASAGHNPLLMYRASTKQCVEINPGGIALGFDKDGRLFERNMKEETIQLQRGDRVVIYTDGVTEAMSPEGAEFTSERLIQITTQAANAPSSQYLTTLVNALQAHAQSDDQHDDITIVTVKVG